MSEVITYKPWVNDSTHNQYDGANSRRIALFEQNIEGLQVKVKRMAEGNFVVKTRTPVPPKPVAKKKPPPKKSAEKKAESGKTTSRSRTVPRRTPVVTDGADIIDEITITKPTAKKKPTKKTTRKRK